MCRCQVRRRIRSQIVSGSQRRKKTKKKEKEEDEEEAEEELGQNLQLGFCTDLREGEEV